MVTLYVLCPACDSRNVIRFGTNASGKQRYRCRACKKTFVQQPTLSRLDDPVFVAQVLACYQERASMRGVARVFGISRNTLADLIKKAENLPELAQTLLPAMKGEVLELDEMWSFVGHKKNKTWVWLALCRRTRQVVVVCPHFMLH